MSLFRRRRDPAEGLSPWKCTKCEAVFMSGGGRIQAGACAAEVKCETAPLVPLLERDKRRYGL